MRTGYVLFLFLLPVLAAADRIPVRYIGGRVCIQCELAVGEQSLPAHLVVDVGAMYPLILDKEGLSAFEIQKTDRFTLTLPTLSQIRNLPYQSADLSSLRTFTKEYAGQLREIPVLGVIGLPAFDQQAVRLDIQQAVLEYGDIIRAGSDWQSMQWSQTESGYRIAVNPSEDYTLQAGFITSSYETWIDSVCASIAGFPGGDFDQIMSGGINIVEMTAIRPVEFDTSSHPDVMLGNSFWQNFEVIFEPATRTIWLRDKKNRLSDLGEQRYFQALVDEDPDAIEDYIEHNPSSRVISEAIEKLIEMHLNASVADKEAITRACDRLIRHRSPKDAAEKLIGFADWLFEQKRYEDDVIAVLLEQAKACSMKSTDALILGYEAMGRLGRYAMLKKDWTRARLHLLSALFGQPANPSFNYWMGQYYEANSQWERAWSRYLKAALSNNPHPDAVPAIGKLNNNPAFRQAFSMQDAQDFLDGYVPVFNPADIPQPLQKKTLLIEALTCGDDKASAPLELALQALDGVDDVIVANYHLGIPSPEPLENAASRTAAAAYAGNRIPLLVINGSVADANQLPLLNPADIIQGLAAYPSVGPVARLQVQVSAVSGQDQCWQVMIPLDGLKQVQRGDVLLVEHRCMLFSSTQIIMFRNVVRAGLYNQIPAPQENRITAKLDLNAIQSDNQSYVKSIQDTGQFAFSMIPEYIDPRMCSVIVKLYDSERRLVAVGKQALNNVQEGSYGR